MLKDLSRINTKVQLFNGQHWKINQEKAFRYATFFEGGKPVEVEFASETTERIYPQIKLVYDQRGKIIAQRLNSNCRLLTTQCNEWLTCQKVHKERLLNALNVYSMLAEIEKRERRKQRQRQVKI